MKSLEVYKITNKITNKVYIGITNQGSGARYRHHWYESRIGEPSPIHKSMAKYGESNFTLEIIDFADNYEELKEKEKYWILFYNSKDRKIGYNLTDCGDGTFGRKHSEETKEKIRQKALGRKVPEEIRKKMSETKKLKYTDAQRRAVAASNAKRTKHILMYDLSMNFIKEYNSMKEAALENNIHIDTIRNYIKGITKNPKVIFKYKE